MKYKLEDLIDIEQFQNIQDRLSEIYSFPSAIIDNDGNILTASEWQDICTKFHRVNPECEKECLKSDKYILDHIHEANPAVSYKCPHGLVDNATPIIIDGVHYGNFFTGQFFLEAPDLDFFKKQAEKYGFDEEDYLEAVRKVPIWSQQQLDSYLFFIKGLIEIISGIGLKNLREIESTKIIAENEEQFRSVFELAPSGMLLLGLDCKFLKVNSSFCKMLGYSEKEILSMTLRDITYPDDISKSNNWINQLLEGGSKTVDFEKRYISRSGQILWVNIRSVLKRDHEGKPDCFISHIQDITKKKMSEEALAKSHAIYHDLVETAQDLIWQCDAEGRYIYLNPAWEDVFGYEIKEMLGKKFTDFQTEEWAKRDLKEFRRLMSHNMVKGLETVHHGKNGKEIHLLFNAKFVQDENGKVTGTRGTAQDISEIKKAEKALKESEYKYSSLFGSMNEGVALHQVVYDANNKAVDYIILESNPAYERHTGIKGDKAKNQLATKIYGAEPAPYLEIFSTVADTGNPTHFETYFPPLNKHFDISVFSLGKGTFATVFKDITESKKDEEELRQKIEELEWNNEMMVNREIKMVELKEEINELLKELGRGEKYVIHK